jgi:[acyl-carrier-protein] S-malonyltransferase
VEWFGANGVTTLYEIGAGKVLSGLARRINRDIATSAVGTPPDVEAALA